MNELDARAMTSAVEDGQDGQLLSQVCPPGWRNPAPAPLYDLVVIGGGTAGLVSAAGAAGLGARVALVERARLGGDCLNTGCVPSKALLRAARVVHEARRGAELGVTTLVAVDFTRVMSQVRSTRAALAVHDSAHRLATRGVDVFFGQASFTAERSVAVDGAVLRFRKAIIATGSRPALPPIRGLAPGVALTSDSLFSLEKQPGSLLIIGAGPVGCEMAQAFALLGTRVMLVGAAPRVLAREDPDASAVIARHLEGAGVTVVTGMRVEQIGHEASGVSVVLPGQSFTADAVLLAAGREPAVADVNPAAAGVEIGGDGIVVDDRLRTTNPGIFAAGDVCSRYRYTHAADAMARIAVQNALFFGRKRASALVIPRCTYTFPELAHVGAETGPGPRETVTIPLDGVDRAVIDREEDGFVRIAHRRGRVSGATIVAPHAGDLIGHLASLIQRKGTLSELSHDIFTYPTASDALRKAGDAYRRGLVTPAVKTLLSRYFSAGRR